LKKKLALEIFVSGVVVFDIVGWNIQGLPIWQFFPMWAWAIVEIEIGARVISWLGKRVHLSRFFRLRPSHKQ
jgi:hypothetical protein